jgi:UDP-galactopyranose mutase
MASWFITIICKEFSVDGTGGEPYYPINDEANTALAAHYQERAAAKGYILGGRLGRYC